MVKDKTGFTASRVEGFKCHPDRMQTIYWDAKVPNFGLRVTSTETKSYIFETWFSGKCLRITIGNAKSWSLAAAQKEAMRLKVLTDKGIDPREERAAIQAINLAKHSKTSKGIDVWEEYIKDRSSKWGERHIADHQLMIKKGGNKITRGARTGKPKLSEDGILRGLLSLPLSEINREEIIKWMKKESVIRPT